MGRERTRAREYICFCTAGLIVFSLSGCATMQNMRVRIKGQVEASQYLHRGKELLAQGDYEGAFNENSKILSLDLHRPPEDKALFNMGLIQAHPGNPKKDHVRSSFFFKKLLEDFPDSSWGEQAKIWAGILDENEKLKQTLGTLNHIIETLKKVNTKVEEREEIREVLFRSQKLLADGNYEESLKENQKVIFFSGKNPPGDEALFNIGLIYAHFGNPRRDYGKALLSFNKLMKDFPQSPFVEQARIWVGMLQENQKLNQTIQKLNQVLEESKQVDIEIEERKREKAK